MSLLILPSQMTYSKILQGLPLSKTKSIRMYSSSVTPLSNGIVRGKCQKRRHISTSNPNSSKYSGTTETELTQHLGHSLPASRVTTRKLRWQQDELERAEHDSTPSALLYRMQVNDLMKNLSRRNLDSTSQSTPGWQRRKENSSRYQRTSPKPSNLRMEECLISSQPLTPLSTDESLPLTK